MLTMLIALALAAPVPTANLTIADEAPPIDAEFGEIAAYVDEFPLGDPGVWACFVEGAPAYCLVTETLELYSMDVGTSLPTWAPESEECDQW